MSERVDELGRQPVRGMIDEAGPRVRIRRELDQLADRVFTRRGAIPLRTPLLEREETVERMYGEEFDKEVFWLTEPDEKSKSLLRYDLTLPGARFVGSHGLQNFRRYQFQESFRRDQPNFTQGRYRQFTQCDFDIYGDDRGTGVYDFELLDAVVDYLENAIGPHYTIEVNDREFIWRLLREAGVPEELIPTTTSTLDKLEKKTREELTTELQEKKIPEEAIEKIWAEVDSPRAVDSFVTEGSGFARFWRMIEESPCRRFIRFNPFLARGLDYYTGMIFEVKYDDSDVISTTIAAGGRYDTMVGRFSTHERVPAVGASFGIDRLIMILAEKIEETLEPTYDLYVASAGKWGDSDALVERTKLICELRRAGFSVTGSTTENPRFGTQLQEVFKRKIPLMLVLGQREVDSGVVKLKEIEKKTEITVARDEVVAMVAKMLA